MTDSLQNKNTRIAKNTLALYVRMAITMVVSFFTVRVTLHVLGSEDYGLNNLVASIVMMFSFINGSMGTAVQRFYSVEIGKNQESRLEKVFGVGIFLHLCVAGITLLIGEIFALGFLHMLNIPPERFVAAMVVFQISLFQLILNILNVPYAAMLRAREQFDKLAILDILQAVGRLVILYLLYIISFDKLITLSCLNLCITLGYVGGVVFLARKFKETKFHIDRDKALVKEMTGFISLLLFTVLASLLRDKGIVVLINLFFGLLVNAAYAIANQMMSFASNFAMSFKQAIVPQLVSAYSAGDRRRMEDLIGWGTKITYILLLAVTAPIILDPHFFLDIILVDVPDKAPLFTVLLMVNVNVSSFTYFLYQAVHATGQIKGQQAWMTGLYLLNILLIWVVYKLGADCFAGIYVTIACSAAQCIINMVFARRTFSYNLRHFGSITVRSLLIALLLFAPLFFLRQTMTESWPRFIALSGLAEGILVALSCSLYLSGQERTRVWQYIKGFIKKD